MFQLGQQRNKPRIPMQADEVGITFQLIRLVVTMNDHLLQQFETGISPCSSPLQNRTIQSRIARQAARGSSKPDGFDNGRTRCQSTRLVAELRLRSDTVQIVPARDAEENLHAPALQNGPLDIPFETLQNGPIPEHSENPALG